MIKFLLFIWQLPQNLLGLLVILILKGIYREEYNFPLNVKVFAVDQAFGVSLGNYIIVSKNHLKSRNVVPHEYGHCRQSLYFGWLYLILVGIPSITMNLLSRIKPTGKFAKNYYNRYPENWADELGGVVR